MQAFTKLCGIAAPLPLANVDTDQILPKQFLKTVKRTGLGDGLFYDLRFSPLGAEVPDFVLNQPRYRGARILITGENFGCGSSREHAPWALLDYGIRCVIAPSFAEIFYQNCINNGLLPVKLPQAAVQSLTSESEATPNGFAVDLEHLQVRAPSGSSHTFEINNLLKKRLLSGLDLIGDTLQYSGHIARFEEKQRTCRFKAD